MIIVQTKLYYTTIVSWYFCTIYNCSLISLILQYCYFLLHIDNLPEQHVLHSFSLNFELPTIHFPTKKSQQNPKVIISIPREAWSVWLGWNTPRTVLVPWGSQKLALGAVATGATGLTIHHNTKVRILQLGGGGWGSENQITMLEGIRKLMLFFFVKLEYQHSVYVFMIQVYDFVYWYVMYFRFIHAFVCRKCFIFSEHLN